MTGRSNSQRLVVLACCVFAAIQCGTTGHAGDPARYRTGAPDARIRQVPAEIEHGVFSDPDQYLVPLVRKLTEGAADDFHKVKILHDWIAENIAYDVESYFSDSGDETTVADALAERRAVCFGYASIFSRMCAVAGVRCVDISGYGRGYGFISGRSVDVNQVNHAWNAIQIDDHWYLIDVTWDAGYVEGQAFRKEYRTTYLFMEPRYFVFTHLPSDPRWQLLSTPLTHDHFRRLPYLLGPFFDHDLRLLTRLGHVTAAGESVQFSVHVPAGSELMAKLTDPDGEKRPQRTLVQQDGERCKVFAVFPLAGRWTVQLFARSFGSKDQFSLAAALDFEATAGTPDRFFPKTFNAYGTLRGGLRSPLYLPLPTGKPLLFKVRLHDAGDVRLAIGDATWLRLARDPDDRELYQVVAPVSAGESVRLNVRTNPAEKEYDTVIGFDVPESD